MPATVSGRISALPVAMIAMRGLRAVNGASRIWSGMNTSVWHFTLPWLRRMAETGEPSSMER